MVSGDPMISLVRIPKVTVKFDNHEGELIN